MRNGLNDVYLTSHGPINVLENVLTGRYHQRRKTIECSRWPWVSWYYVPRFTQSTHHFTPSSSCVGEIESEVNKHTYHYWTIVNLTTGLMVIPKSRVWLQICIIVFNWINCFDRELTAGTVFQTTKQDNSMTKSPILAREDTLWLQKNSLDTKSAFDADSLLTCSLPPLRQIIRIFHESNFEDTTGHSLLLYFLHEAWWLH